MNTSFPQKYFCAIVIIFLWNVSTTVACDEKNKTDHSVEKKTLSDKEAIDIARKTWKVILNDLPNDPKLKKEGGIEYWTGGDNNGFDAFHKMLKGSKKEVKIKFYVDQFGKHGSQADMQWFSIARRFTLASTAKIPEQKDQPLDYRIYCLFAKHQVLQFTKDPALLKRFYEGTIWYKPYDGFFGKDRHDKVFGHGALGLTVRVIHERMKDIKKESYWGCARNFMLLAYATGREDLLKNIKPEKLYPQYVKWEKWMLKERNGAYLRASSKEPRWVLDKGEKKRQEMYFPFLENEQMELPPLKIKPKYPFPDWKGPKPGTPAEHRETE